MIQIIPGDLLNATEQYICHQTNCMSKGGAAGLAYYLFRKFPYADCYSDRTLFSQPGTIDIRGNGQDQRLVINMHAQLYPGQYNDQYDNDNQIAREKYFHQCLLRIAKIDNLESIAFPFAIGCGISGCDWNHYSQMLENFAAYVEKTQGTQVVIYQREEDQ